MKAILSYHHSMLSNRRDLADSEYYYTIPIVLSHHPPLSRLNQEKIQFSIVCCSLDRRNLMKNLFHF